MTILLYFSDFLISIAVLIVFILLLVLLVGPFWIFYVVFRDAEKRAVEVAKVRKFSKWISLACAIVFAISACLSITEFGDEDYRLRLAMISLGSVVAAFISGLISLPHWQGILGILCSLIYGTFLIRLDNFRL